MTPEELKAVYGVTFETDAMSDGSFRTRPYLGDTSVLLTPWNDPCKPEDFLSAQDEHIERFFSGLKGQP